LKKYLVEPGQKVKLSEWDPNDTSEFKGGKEQGRVEVLKQNLRLRKLQEVLFAEHKHKILIVLQAMDTGGKDGVIQHVFEGVNPNGTRVANFKQPAGEELEHDYLWRVHRQVPAKGELVIFNRSHYEDVLVVRVHKLVPEDTWKQRYDQINAFEKILVENGTTVLKFMLHISRDEQRERLQDRLDKPESRWKFNPGDLEDRKLWDDYQQAYEVMLEKCSTDWAPWYVIPADRKWARNAAVAGVVLETLEAMAPQYPKPDWDPKDFKVE